MERWSVAFGVFCASFSYAGGGGGSCGFSVSGLITLLRFVVVASSSRLRSVAVSSSEIVPVNASLTGRGVAVSCSVIGRD